jgi:D-arabinose 1-dehydrogenase-like Zn-dependent alcohol dehydrogenase
MASDFAGKEYTVFRGIDKKVTATKTTVPALGPKDILVRITHAGVCHTDALFFENGAPLALGHEGVGIVEAIGFDVTQFKVGDRAGGGFHRNSCGHCIYCLSGRDILCYDRVIFGEGDFDNGTFGQYYVGKETYLHRIPDSMLSEDAAPLHCAGATVYSALKYTVKPSSRVGIIGIGGLGHIAIQIAAKMGADVVALSTSASKEKEARDFGATEFVLLNEIENVKAPVDVLVLTGAKYPDWDK